MNWFNKRLSIIHDASAILGVLLVAYLLTFNGQFHSIDEFNLYAMTESLVQLGSTSVPQTNFAAYHNQVGEHEIGFPIVAVPLYALAKNFKFLNNIYFVMLLNPFLVALSSALIYLIARELDYSASGSAFSAFAYGFGSLGWFYALSFYREPLVGFLLLVSIYGMLGWRNLGNRSLLYIGILALLLSPLVKVNILFSLPFLFLVARKRDQNWTWRTYVAVSAVLLGVFLLFQLLYYWRTGGWWDYLQILQTTPYQILLRIYGQLLSPVKGLVFYMPIFVLAMFGLWNMRRRHPFVTTGLGLAFMALLGATSFYSVWYGGQSWGPRLLVPIIPIIMIPLAGLWDRLERWPLRVLVLLLFLVSVSIQFAVATNDWWKGYKPLHALDPFPEKNVGLSWRHISLTPPWVLLKTWRFSDSTLLWLRKNALDVWSCQIGIGVSLVLCLLSVAALWRLLKGKPQPLWIVMPVLPALLIMQLGDRHITVGYPGLSPDNAEVIADWTKFRGEDPYTLVTMSNEFHIYFYTGLLTGDFVHHWYSPNQLDHFEGILQNTKGPWLSLVADRVHIEPSYSGKELERWLNNNFYRFDAHWVGGYELIRYANFLSANWTWQPVQYKVGPFYVGKFAVNTNQLEHHEALGIQLQLCKSNEIPSSHKIFLHLLRQDGEILPGLDGAIRYNGLDTTQWQRGDCLIERRGIYVPKDAQPGAYDLVLGVSTSEGPVMLTDTTGVSSPYKPLISVDISGSDLP